MSGWDGIPLPPYLRELTAAPILLDNDANVIVLSERRGQRERFDDMLLIKASTGLGAGIVAGGVLQRGAVGAAGEFGHSKIPAAAGVACRCGDTGCLEAIAGGWALVRAMQQHGRGVGHIRDLVDLAVGGDPEARRTDPGKWPPHRRGTRRRRQPAQPRSTGHRWRHGEGLRHLRRGLARDRLRQRDRIGYPRTKILPSTHGDQSGVIG